MSRLVWWHLNSLLTDWETFKVFSLETWPLSLLAVFWERDSYCSRNWTQGNPSYKQKTLKNKTMLLVLRSLFQRGCVCCGIMKTSLLYRKMASDLVVIFWSRNLRKDVKKNKDKEKRFLFYAPGISWYGVWACWGELACPLVLEWGLLIYKLQDVIWPWVMLRSHRGPGFGCWERLLLWMLILGCRWVGEVRSMSAGNTLYHLDNWFPHLFR